MDVTPIAGGAQLRMSHHRVSFSVGLQNLLRAKSDAKATALAPVVKDMHLAPGELSFGFRCIPALNSSGFFLSLCLCHNRPLTSVGRDANSKASGARHLHGYSGLKVILSNGLYLSLSDLSEVPGNLA
jgi:hypothetical protein